MQKFLDTEACWTAVRRMLASGEPVRAAVAYWGRGAVEQLGITAQTDLTVVCDVRSGGCNPMVVRQLLDLLGPDRVLTYDGLHAKAWVGRGTAIVGSSNASANGLGFEGPETAPLLEANIQTDSRSTITSLQAWMDGVVMVGARRIMPKDLRVAAKRHHARRDARPMPVDKDLLSALRKVPEAFSDRDAYVWVWKPEAAAEWAQGELKAVRAERGDEGIDFYQDLPDPPAVGARILDFHVGTGGVTFAGLWQTLGERHLHEAADGQGTLLLCRETKKFDDLPIGSLREWRRAAGLAANSDQTSWQLADFARRFLMDQDGSDTGKNR